jgi:hypothetical protein
MTLWLKADYIFYIEAHSIHSLHQAVCRELSQHNDVEEKHLLRAFEHLYWEDSTEASQLFVAQRQCFTWCLKTFLRTKQDSISCSFWWENHKMHDINIRKLSLLRISHESTSSTTFSILLKTQWIVSCIMHRHTLRLYRSKSKCARFAAYLSTWKCSWCHTMRNSW